MKNWSLNFILIFFFLSTLLSYGAEKDAIRLNFGGPTFEFTMDSMPLDFNLFQEIGTTKNSSISSDKKIPLFVYSNSDQLSDKGQNAISKLELQNYEVVLVNVSRFSSSDLQSQKSFWGHVFNSDVTSRIYSFTPQPTQHLKADEITGPNSKVGTLFSRSYSPPTADEAFQGAVMAASKGVIVGSIWLSLDGVDPLLASSITAAMVFYEYIFSTNIRTFDNLVGGYSESDHRRAFDLKDPKSRREIFLRMAHTTVMAYFWRTLTGPIGAAHSILTLQGNMEVIANAIVKIPSYIFGSIRHNNLSRRAAAWVGFPLFLLGPILSNMDLFGVKLLDLYRPPAITWGEMIIYQPSLPIITLLGLQIGTTALIQWGPKDKIEHYAEKFENYTQKLRDALKTSKEKIKFRLNNILKPLSCLRKVKGT